MDASNPPENTTNYQQPAWLPADSSAVLIPDLPSLRSQSTLPIPSSSTKTSTTTAMATNIPIHDTPVNTIHTNPASGSNPKRYSRSSLTFVSQPILQAAIKSDEEIKQIQSTVRDRRKAKAVAAFYHNQNELIEELLKPVDDGSDEDESKHLIQLKIAMYGSLAANILLLGLQLFAAITSGSLSLFATMADSFMDLASNVVLVVASISASKKNLQRFPAGKQRFETAGIVVFSCIMGAMAVQLVIEGATALSSGEHSTNLGAVNLACIGVAVGVKACLYLYCRALSKYPSAEILAQDHRNDVILNLTGILLSVLGHQLKWWVDPVGGILIALYILINWGQTAIEHIQMFIGKSASQTFLSRVTYIAMTHHPEVLQVDTVRAYSSGAGYFVEVDIVMDAVTPLMKAHDVGEALQVKIESLEGVERAFVHIDYESTHHPEHPC